MSIAFQNPNGILQEYGSLALLLGMNFSSSPSLCPLGAAAEGGDNQLWVIPNLNTAQPWGHLMQPGTSPSIVDQDGINVAFHGVDGNLWVVTRPFDRNNPTAGAQGMQMWPGTSPSICRQGTGWSVAFHAPNENDPNGILWVVGNNNWGKTQYGMKMGTSPSICQEGNGVSVAFQASGGDLWLVGNRSPQGSLGVQMSPSTSPSACRISIRGSDSVAVAFQNIFGFLQVAGDFNETTGYQMAPGTSPSIIPTNDGSWRVAFQSISNILCVYGPTTGGLLETGQQMNPWTSPAYSEN